MKTVLLMSISMGIGFVFFFMGCSDDVPDQSNPSDRGHSDGDSDADSDSDSDADGDTDMGPDRKETRDSDTSHATADVCHPGERQPCTCGDITGGLLTCNSDGNGWSACICDGGGDTDSEVLTAVDSDTASNIDFDCATGEAQLHVVVTANTQSDYLPWELWPDDADGEGNLVVSLSTDNGSVYRESIMSADFSYSTKEVAVNFCTPYTSGAIDVFLDDDLDAREGATFSGDYVDTCLGTNDGCFRCMNVELTPNSVTEISAVLEGSCD